MEMLRQLTWLIFVELHMPVRLTKRVYCDY